MSRCRATGCSSTAIALLVHTGILDAPSKLFIFNQTAVMITMAVIYLPYAILPIFLSLERISPSLMAASADLGGRPGQTFRHVVLPLSLPGSIVGALFVMVLALGDYLTPQMVGGNQGFTFGRAIWSQFGMAFNWPFGAALAVVLLLSVVLIILVAAAISPPCGGEMTTAERITITLLWAIDALVFVVLYGPAFMVVLLSFFAINREGIDWGSFGFQWYARLGDNPQMHRGARQHAAGRGVRRRARHRPRPRPRLLHEDRGARGRRSWSS